MGKLLLAAMGHTLDDCKLLSGLRANTIESDMHDWFTGNVITTPQRLIDMICIRSSFCSTLTLQSGGVQLSRRTSPPCVENVYKRSPVKISQSFTEKSAPPETRNSLS